jgi:hypothetical protein
MYNEGVIENRKRINKVTGVLVVLITHVAIVSLIYVYNAHLKILASVEIFEKLNELTIRCMNRQPSHSEVVEAI